MLTKIEYLKKCIINLSVIENKSWYVSCFAIPILKEEPNWESKSILSLVTKMDGLYFIDYDEASNKILVKIVDYKKDLPLFNFQDEIEIDGSWLPSIKGKIKTKIGILIVNALVIYSTLKTKVDYINSVIKVSTIEALLIDRTKNKEELTDKDISVDEMVNCMDRLTFLSNLGTITCIAATPKAITPPPGIDKIRKELLKEYEGKLNDPVKVVELEAKLTEIDNAYLADDPAAKNIFNKKSKTARKKLYLMYGQPGNFRGSASGTNVITVPISKGISVDDKDLPNYMNDLRSASFDRGASTALSGYSYKILQRSLSGVTISKEPCNTTKGLTRLITKSNYNKIVNRYIKLNGWKLVKNLEEAKTFIDKEVEIRSVMYCKAKEHTVCFACMSEVYKNTPSGITNLAANISSVLMILFLKKMHGSITETHPINMKDLIS